MDAGNAQIRTILKPKPMETIKFKMPKTKQGIIDLFFVDDLFFEGDKGGWWIYFSDGYKCQKMECGTIHEMTVPECLEALSEGVYKI